MIDTTPCPSAHYTGTDPAPTVSPWPGWLALFVATLILYAATANRGAQWQDSGHHMLRIVTGESASPLGLALSHPLHHWLGRLVVATNILEPSFAITLLSALAAAVAVANTYGCVVTLTQQRTAALLAAVSLAIAHTFWQMATLTETYTLTAALLSAECWCLIGFARIRCPWLLSFTLLCNGLGIANHMLASLTTPVLIVVVWTAWRSRDVKIRYLLIAAAAWLAGTLPYTAMVAGELAATGDVAGTIRSALFGHSFGDEVLGLVPSASRFAISLTFIALNFPNLLLPAALYGIIRLKAQAVPTLARRALVVMLALHVLFAIRYEVMDQHMFFLPSYVLLAIFGGVGFAAAWSRFSTRTRRAALGVAVVLLLITPGVYALTPSIARRFDVLRLVQHHKPYRDDYVYLFLPWSVVERSADRMSREAVQLAGERGLIVVEDPMAEFAVRYQKIRSGKDEVTITRDPAPEEVRWAMEYAEPVVLVPLDREAPQPSAPPGVWHSVGDLYILSAAVPGE